LAKDFTDTELLRIWDHVKEVSSMQEMADRFGLTFGALNSRLYRARKGEAASEKLFDFGVQKEDKPFRISGDALIVGDVHVPYTDWELAGMVSAVGASLGIKTLIIAGDLFDLDVFSLWSPVTLQASWGDERRAATALVNEWLQTFEEIIIITGNHDRRIQRKLDGQFGAIDFLNLLGFGHEPRVMWSNWGHMIVDTPRGEWRVTHGKQYSVNQLVVADQMALKFDQNIMSHHEHHLAIGHDRYKRHVVVNNGCLVDPEKLAYVNLDDTKMAGMIRGFATIIDGYPQIYGNSITDWKKILG